MMNLELFRFVKRSAATSSSAYPLAVITRIWPTGEDAATSRSEDPTAPPSNRRRFNSEWSEGRVWLNHNRDNDVMFCEWCRRFDRDEHRNQFVKECALMKLESTKKHKLSRQHKDSEASQCARARPDHAPMELVLQTMERDELEQMKMSLQHCILPRSS